jgi:hypothetical protein
MENYIVRIYRRDSDDPSKLTGICESVEKETRDSFNTLGKLVSLISPARAAPYEDAEVDNGTPETGSKVISLAD